MNRLRQRALAVALSATVLLLVMLATDHARCDENPGTEGVTFIAFDMETTGLDRQRDEPVEIAAVKFRDGKILETRSWLIKPSVPLSPEASELTGITPEMLQDAPSFPEVYSQFADFTGTNILLAHNASFDMRFLAYHAGEKHGMNPPSNRVMDTLRLARRAFPEMKSHSLETLREKFGIETGSPHRALHDSLALVNVFAECALALRENSLSELLKISEYRRRKTTKPEN